MLRYENAMFSFFCVYLLGIVTGRSLEGSGRERDVDVTVKRIVSSNIIKLFISKSTTYL